ncbi:hypothetical protein FKP32DRAFT_1604129 [Trametes sanguinea]|nr:hypothetical protein FKP32DRAFT_1604129 [Trametes sanguinea]
MGAHESQDENALSVAGDSDNDGVKSAFDGDVSMGEDYESYSEAEDEAMEGQPRINGGTYRNVQAQSEGGFPSNALQAYPSDGMPRVEAHMGFPVWTNSGGNPNATQLAARQLRLARSRHITSTRAPLRISSFSFHLPSEIPSSFPPPPPPGFRYPAAAPIPSFPPPNIAPFHIPGIPHYPQFNMPVRTTHPHNLVPSHRPRRGYTSANVSISTPPNSRSGPFHVYGQSHSLDREASDARATEVDPDSESRQDDEIDIPIATPPPILGKRARSLDSVSSDVPSTGSPRRPQRKKTHISAVDTVEGGSTTGPSAPPEDITASLMNAQNSHPAADGGVVGRTTGSSAPPGDATASPVNAHNSPSNTVLERETGHGRIHDKIAMTTIQPVSPPQPSCSAVVVESTEADEHAFASTEVARTHVPPSIPSTPEDAVSSLQGDDDTPSEQTLEAKSQRPGFQTKNVLTTTRSGSSLSEPSCTAGCVEGEDAGDTIGMPYDLTLSPGQMLRDDLEGSDLELAMSERPESSVAPAPALFHSPSARHSLEDEHQNSPASPPQVMSPSTPPIVADEHTSSTDGDTSVHPPGSWHADFPRHNERATHGLPSQPSPIATHTLQPSELHPDASRVQPPERFHRPSIGAPTASGGGSSSIRAPAASGDGSSSSLVDGVVSRWETVESSARGPLDTATLTGSADGVPFPMHSNEPQPLASDLLWPAQSMQDIDHPWQDSSTKVPYPQWQEDRFRGVLSTVPTMHDLSPPFRSPLLPPVSLAFMHQSALPSTESHALTSNLVWSTSSVYNGDYGDHSWRSSPTGAIHLQPQAQPTHQATCSTSTMPDPSPVFRSPLLPPSRLQMTNQSLTTSLPSNCGSRLPAVVGLATVDPPHHEDSIVLASNNANPNETVYFVGNLEFPHNA